MDLGPSDAETQSRCVALRCSTNERRTKDGEARKLSLRRSRTGSLGSGKGREGKSGLTDRDRAGAFDDEARGHREV